MRLIKASFDTSARKKSETQLQKQKLSKIILTTNTVRVAYCWDSLKQVVLYILCAVILLDF